MSPLAGAPGLCPVVPDGSLKASVADMCNVVPGEAVPIPTLDADTSNTKSVVSNAKSVPDLSRLAFNICPDIRPIAIKFYLRYVVLVKTISIYSNAHFRHLK